MCKQPKAQEIDVWKQNILTCVQPEPSGGRPNEPPDACWFTRAYPADLRPWMSFFFFVFFRKARVCQEESVNSRNERIHTLFTISDEKEERRDGSGVPLPPGPSWNLLTRGWSMYMQLATTPPTPTPCPGRSAAISRLLLHFLLGVTAEVVLFPSQTGSRN